jgi:NADH dehydrogenase
MILVAGCTGLVGGLITRSLLERGQDVRVLVRSGSPYQPFVDAGAEPIQGDLKDAASLAAACHGVDVVITTASAGQRGGADTPESVDLEGNRNLIEAARAAGVRQFIFVSALTASEHSPVPLARAKAQTETALRRCGVPYTIIAANGIMDVNLPLVVGEPVRAGRPVTLVREGRRRHSFVAARDVAAFTVSAVGNRAALNRRIPVGGPTAVSWRDIVAAYERVLGRSIAVQWIEPGELIPNLPPVPGLAELVSGLMAWLETFDSPIDMTESARTFGVTLTPLEEFIAGALVQAQ